MEDALLSLAVQALPILGVVFQVLGAIVVLVAVVIKLTPSKADDQALEAIKGIPLVGGIIAALVGRSPVQEKKTE